MMDYLAEQYIMDVYPCINDRLLYLVCYILYKQGYTIRNTIMDPAQAATIAFEDALMRIGFGLPERTAIIEMSGCRNIAMLGLLTTDQVSKVCKRIETRQVNPLPITTLQEQLLLALRFWVTNRQRLQLPILAADFTMVIALNQAQVM
jgi:hypothetical protein